MKIISVAAVAFSFLVFSQTIVAQTNDKILESLGATSAVCVYNTYTTIGLLADCHVNQVYEDTYVKELLTEQIGMLENLVTQYNGLIAEKTLTETDAKYMKDLVSTLEALKLEAQSLKSMVEFPDNTEYATKYSSYRDEAWGKIATLLGLE